MRTLCEHRPSMSSVCAAAAAASSSLTYQRSRSPPMERSGLNAASTTQSSIRVDIGDTRTRGAHYPTSLVSKRNALSSVFCSLVQHSPTRGLPRRVQHVHVNTKKRASCHIPGTLVRTHKIEFKFECPHQPTRRRRKTNASPILLLLVTV
jgi:hypothetical protein